MKIFNFYKVCGVSILRAGECLEPALCEVYKDAVIGKILIQTNDQTGEPEVRIQNNSFFKGYLSV